jgi:hypothetical protein
VSFRVVEKRNIYLFIYFVGFFGEFGQKLEGFPNVVLNPTECFPMDSDNCALFSCDVIGLRQINY